MPYRRLPNTDQARLKALKTAFSKGKELPPFKLAFSQSTFQKVISFLPLFEKIIVEQRMALKNQAQKNRDYQQHLRKARLYISHFIQVLNMSIIRGEIPANMRGLYGLSEDEKKIPLLNTEADIIEWGEKIIKGETERIRRGGNPLYNPTIAVVKVRYENFLDAYQMQKTLKKTSERFGPELNEMRGQADAIIVALWNEVEEYFKDLSDPIRRERASQYGLSYVYRKNELVKINYEFPELRVF